ncbi:Gfo/Idh/MocA family protein [Nocardiopsis composta]|uniref:Inositol 2-dehydrogenase n=1 Tax=Nocardiopsis composta TaxID=157465 RepID=A0A7W8VFD4_9ACTN|nr:Gfo/Idh/MocA family oxidoreductase [Nocardiopsis composta]MBB5434292.1 myo-inositol 2-dehydrogenase/D-chiro-inositol 1-dehydrogenase [Nocardiopsis composta]
MPLNVGLVGAGMIGADHARRIGTAVAGARVAAVTDIDPDRAAAVAASCGARTAASDREVVDAGDVDAVLVASWGPAHAESVLAAVAARKPVFCEKPLATTAEDCLKIIEAEQASGRRLVQVGFMRRYDTGYRALKRLVDGGDLGEPLMVHCVHRNAEVPESYHSAMAVQDTAVHEIDAVRWLLDDEITSAQVLFPKRTRNRFDHLRDPQVMLFETASGARVDVEVFVNCRYGYDIRCEVVGETGTAELPPPAEPAVRSAARLSTAVVQDWKDRFADAYDTEIREWTAAAAEGTASGPSSWDGYAAAVVTDAAVRSQQTGDVVPTGIGRRPDFYA